jgi:transcriptional regulator with XRE-family HTH domain
MKLNVWHERQLARDPEYAKAIAEIAYAQRVADAVAAERIRVGLTQEELADRAGTTQARISEIERGVGNPTLDTVERVFAALRVVSGAGEATNLLAAITTVKAEAFGFVPGVSASAFWPIVIPQGFAITTPTIWSGAVELNRPEEAEEELKGVLGAAPSALALAA